MGLDNRTGLVSILYGALFPEKITSSMELSFRRGSLMGFSVLIGKSNYGK